MTKRLPTRRDLGVLGLAGAMSVGSAAVPGWRRAARAAPATQAKIALIAPLSGPWARQGQLLRMGAEMAVDEVNQKGGIKSLGGAKLALVVADTGASTETAKNAAQRLLSEQPDLVGGMGCWLSSFTLAVTEVTERAHLPWITLSYSDLITGRGFKYIFQTSPTGGRQAQQTLPAALRLAEGATGKRPRTVGILMDNTAAPVSFAKPLVEGGGLKKLGLDLVVDEIFTPPLSDATPLVQRVRSTHPDFLLLLVSSVPDNRLVLEKLDEFNLSKGRLPLIGNGAPLGTPELKKAIGAELLDGLMFSVANWGLKGQEDIIARFKKRTGEPWMTQDGIDGYGHVWILEAALEAAGAANREKVADAIRKMDLTTGPAALAFPGPIRFDAQGRRVDAPVIFVQWQNGVPLTVFPADRAQAQPIWRAKV